MIVVTGASRGIGLAIAERLTCLGYDVLGLSRSSATFNFDSRSVDVTSCESLKAVAIELRNQDQKLSALINVAGVASMNLAVMTPEKSVRSVIETNLMGTIFSCQAFAPLMIRNNSGSIINFSTIAVALGLSGESIYAASKSGVESFTRTLSRELSGHGISVNCIAPGPIDTALLSGITNTQIKNIINRQVIQQQFTTQDICDVVELLIDARSKSISGHVLHVGGV